LPSEKKKLYEKAKKMADKYSWIVFTHKSIGSGDDGHTHSYMQFKSKILSNQKADRYFYETMMMFSAKVLQTAFDKKDVPKLEEEINRLFRSNAFNISQRV
jgi:transketolase